MCFDFPMDCRIKCTSRENLDVEVAIEVHNEREDSKRCSRKKDQFQELQDRVVSIGYFWCIGIVG